MDAALIYIVDDEPNILASLKRFLVHEDYAVETFTKGGEALRALAENEAAVIVSDYMMPEMSGVEVLQKAREIAPDTVRVMITGMLDLDLSLEAISRGEVYRIIAKPWSDLELSTTIAQCVEKYRLIQENRALQERLMDQARLETAKAMVVTLNHEINNALVFVSLGIDRLKRSLATGTIPDDHEKYLTEMKSACDRIAGFVKRLRKLEEVRTTEYLEGSGTMMLDSDSL